MGDISPSSGIDNPGAHCLAFFFLPHPPKFWDYKHKPTNLASKWLRVVYVRESGRVGEGVRVSLASAAVLEFSCVCPPISQ